MDKPEEKKTNPPAGQPPRPPIGGKKPDFAKGSTPPKPPGGPPKLPLPGQKPGVPMKSPMGLPVTPPPPVPGSSQGNFKPPQMGNIGTSRPPAGFPGRPPASPPAPPPLSPAVEKGLSEAESNKNDLQDKISDLEKKLMEEREKVLLASLRSKEEEAVSAKVETSIKEIQDKLRREKKEQETEEGRRKAETRALDMERRLAEEREAWVQTLKNQLNQRDQITQEMETHFSARLKDLEYRWSQEKSSLEVALKERDGEIARIRQEMGMKSEQERAFWEDRLRNITVEKEKLEREYERIKDRSQQEKDQLLSERQALKDQVARIESSLRVLEDQHRLERANIGREHETILNSIKQQAASDRDQAEKQTTSMSSQLQSQSKELTEKIGQVESLKSQISNLNLQMEQLTGRLGDRDRQLDALKAKFQDTEVDRQRIQAGFEHANQQKKEMEGMLDETRSIVRSKEAALDEARRARLAVEEELKARIKQDEEELAKRQEELARVRNEYRDEIRRLQNENDERMKALHARLEPFEINAMKIYNETRDKVHKEMETMEKALSEANRKLEQLTGVETDRAQIVQERDLLKQQLEEIRAQAKDIQWSLESQLKASQDELRGEKIKLQQLEENRNIMEQELKQRLESRAYDQALLEERQQEIERLTKNFDTVRKAFESQKIKLSAFTKENEDLKKLLHEKGLKTHEEFSTQMEEKGREIERLQHAIKSLKEVTQETDKKEEMFKEKEKVLRQMIDDKERLISEFKNRMHILENKIDEFNHERDGIKTEARKEAERIIQMKDEELAEKLDSQKKEIMDGFQDQLEKAKFQAAQETAERVRAEMPPVTQNPEMIEAQVRARLEKEMNNQLRDREKLTENALKGAKEESKKESDRLKWELESMKEEAKKARAARDQIEREAQELLQQAEDLYKTQLDSKIVEIKNKVGKKGLFTAIGKILDTPILDFSKKKDEDLEL